MVALTAVTTLLALTGIVSAAPTTPNVEARGIVRLRSNLSNTRSGNACLAPQTGAGTDNNLVLKSCSDPLTAIEYKDGQLWFTAVNLVAEIAEGSHTVEFIRVRPAVAGKQQQQWTQFVDHAGFTTFKAYRPEYCLTVTDPILPGPARTMPRRCDSTASQQFIIA